LLSGVLLWMSYFPVAWGWLCWIALVPVLTLVRLRASGGRVFLAAWMGGLAFFFPVLQWMRVGDDQMYYTWAALATFCSLFLPVAILILRQLDSRTGLLLAFTAPVVWTALEFFRAQFAGGFPWYLLAHTQHDFLPIIQISDLTGAYGVSFLLVAVNGSLAAIIFRMLGMRRLPMRGGEQRQDSLVGLVAQSVVVALLIAGSLIYGEFRLGQQPFSDGPRVALIQCNLEQDVRNGSDAASDAERQRAVETMDEHYAQLQRLAAAQGANLIVWPETSHAQPWEEFSEEFPAHERAAALAKANGATFAEARACATNVLFGFSTFIYQPSKAQLRYNSAVLVDAAGVYQMRYDKMHRVPFGEYIPFVDWAPWMKVFSPYGDVNYSIQSGDQFTRFPIGPYRFGVVICFEDSDPDLARQYVGGDGKQSADFLLNISNDGWFKRTSEHEEHLAISRFRAIECRRSLGRAVNMGITAIIDGNGRVLAPEKTGEYASGYTWEVPGAGAKELRVSRWNEFKNVKGVVTGVIPIDHRTSWYARWGDWLPWTCWFLVAALLVFGWLRGLRPQETASP
jgi:apolipoprotein N-acyltransferase